MVLRSGFPRRSGGNVSSSRSGARVCLFGLWMERADSSLASCLRGSPRSWKFPWLCGHRPGVTRGRLHSPWTANCVRVDNLLQNHCSAGIAFNLLLGSVFISGLFLVVFDHALKFYRRFKVCTCRTFLLKLLSQTHHIFLKRYCWCGLKSHQNIGWAFLLTPEIYVCGEIPEHFIRFYSTCAPLTATETRAHSKAPWLLQAPSQQRFADRYFSSIMYRAT